MMKLPVTQKSLPTAVCLLAMVLLGACASMGPPSSDLDLAASAWARASSGGALDSGWTHQRFPGKRDTVYRAQRKDGRDAVMVRATSSASMLRRKVRIEAADLGRVQFSWLVPATIASADLSQPNSDDSPVRIVLAFEGDRSSFSAKDAVLSELAETLTGEALPYATLMYVWSNRQQAESVIQNPRSGRIRKLVMESGNSNLNRWLAYERDLRSDFLQAFGESPGALLSVAIMTDTDNTRSDASAWYGPIRLLPTP